MIAAVLRALDAELYAVPVTITLRVAASSPEEARRVVGDLMPAADVLRLDVGEAERLAATND